MEFLGLRQSDATAIVQGYGNVGSVTAITLAQRGVKIIGISDHTACYYDPNGIDIEAVERHVAEHGFLRGFSTELAFDPNGLLLQPCDILVPAAVERVIDAKVASALKCRVLAEGANGPTTPDADAVLDQRRDEIFVIPDVLCNSGGVIVSYFEWVQDMQRLFWEEDEVTQRLNQILDRAFNQVMARVKRDRVSHRTAAMAIGVEKVRDGKRRRDSFLK
jgi:glutamate dehydrogenase (NAD(P)+)